MKTITYRHEQKIEIGYGDLLALRARLGAVLKPDPHAPDGRYVIRSLYFDNDRNKALQEKLDGVNHREKFRLRLYNGDVDFIRLEKKSKINGLCRKESVVLTEAQVQALCEGAVPADCQVPAVGDLRDRTPVTAPEVAGTFRSSPAVPAAGTFRDASPLVQEFLCKMRSQGLIPKTLVEYTREAYIYGPGNVRVTLDYDIHTGLSGTDFLNPDCVMVPAGNAPAILEVKWDEYLPDIIRDLIQMPHRRVGAFSKYAACRIYG